jgi:hypothetical protein
MHRSAAHPRIKSGEGGVGVSRTMMPREMREAPARRRLGPVATCFDALKEFGKN